MSTTYRLILMDEFDWGYVGNSREITAEKISEHTHYSTNSTSQYMLIIDVDTDMPSKALLTLKEIGVVWDVAYYQRNNDMELVECRLTVVKPDKSVSSTGNADGLAG